MIDVGLSYILLEFRGVDSEASDFEFFDKYYVWGLGGVKSIVEKKISVRGICR